MMGISNLDQDQLSEIQRQKARQAEIEQNEAGGHREDAGISPHSIPNKTKDTVFQPNDGPNSDYGPHGAGGGCEPEV